MSESIRADVPEGWPTPPPIDVVETVLILGGIPVLLALLIVGYVYLPSIVRGEKISHGNQTPNNLWIGGPRREMSELEASDTEESAAGGASGAW